MRIKTILSVCLLLTIGFAGQGTRGQSTASAPLRVLRNNDVLQMVADGMKSAEIIPRIQTSNCNFDIFPPVLRDLRRRGVPETVLVAMQNAPVGPPTLRAAEVNANTAFARKDIRDGTVIEVESVVPVSSGKAVVGTPITFIVSKRVFIDNVLVIERGAVATGRVTKVRKAAVLGRAGMLAWEMVSVTAVDGTRIGLKLTGEQKGANKAALMAGGAAATAALIFPYSSPVALIWGLKKGDEAVLRGSKVFFAAVNSDVAVTGIQPRQGGVVYHDRETVKASAAPPTSTNFPRGSVKFGGSKN